ncbi:KpsF/GutQ family sugar-phosphate isomerase [Kiritimatiellota bacterium B12222]|nr:KpsF/GutQ family sugar-phosphate isomerase [Kiritimatiellota bacterium B12222]
MNSTHPLLSKAQAYLQTDIDQLIGVKNELDPHLVEALPLLCASLDAGHKLVFTGMGKSYHIGAKCAATFTSTGSPAVLMHPAEAPHGDLGIVNDGDVVLLLSYSGESRELVQLIPLLRRLNVKLISITGSSDNQVAQMSDLNLCVRIQKEACPFNLAPTASALVTLAVCDALAMLLHEERGFTLEAYQKLHPGGAIGESLSLTVRDIMRGEERLPKCNQNESLQQAVLTMTRCKAGAVGVLDEHEKLIGIYTDGDLRRSLAENKDLNSCYLHEAMSLNPITISPDAHASVALDLFSSHNIDDLLVIDEHGFLIGSIDLQDMPKLKFFQSKA